MRVPKKATAGGDSSETTGLQYSSLAVDSKQIRLLTILPSKESSDEVKCLLHHADLEASIRPSYETISYVWGDASCTDRLSVDDIAVTVPASSVAALRRMRLQHENRTVWLDAICINQKDTPERNHQVSMMGDIYRLGVGNLIYLGEDNIDLALTGIDAILEEAESAPESFSKMRNEAGAWQYASVGIGARFDAKALIELYSLSWFRRLWVLQEAALARENTCYCGSSAVELVQLTRAAAWLIYKYYFVDADLRLQCSYAADMNGLVDDDHGYYRKQDGQPASVLYLLDLAQQRLSSVAADKVYGILGLAAESDGQTKLHIQPDYGRTTAEVFRQAAWDVIRSRGDLEILDYVRHWTHDGELKLENFGSWVPKWHRSKDLEEHANFMSLTFDAGLIRKAVIQDQAEASPLHPETLTVSGIHVGTIARTSERIKNEETTRAEYLRQVLNEAEAQLKDSAPEQCDGQGEEVESSLAVTMCAGVDSSYRPADQELVNDYRMFRDYTHERRPRLTSIEGLDQQEAPMATGAARYSEAMYNACMNRKFFTTPQGHIGLGPHFLRQGDKIVVLFGLRWPAVLRPIVAEGGAKQFTFLGTAYCQGIMHGEAVENREGAHESSTNEFCIR